MGINGLHKGLAFCTKKTNVREYSGKALAIDSSSWLHKSVYSVSERYVESMERGHVDPSCVQVSAKYISSRCQELLQVFGVRKIYLVMDGRRCPLKSDTNQERERKRTNNLQDARNFKRQGRRDKAEEKYKTCIKIRDELTVAVMKSVVQRFAGDGRVELIWSPYEADSQLAKLCVDRLADVVVTEVRSSLAYVYILCYFLHLYSQLLSFVRIPMSSYTLLPAMFHSLFSSSSIVGAASAI
jgi:exonuclease-1